MNSQFNDDAKEQVRLRADIGAVVGRYVNLKSRGGTLIGLCPFHKEKTPSFNVNPDRGFYHCFGCGKGGDVFNFLMEIEGIDFREALEMLAEETGVRLEAKKRASDRSYDGRYGDASYDGRYGDGGSLPPSSQNSSAAAKPATKTELLAIHKEAADFYYRQVKGSERAIGYFKSRGLLAETVKEFGLGYAPDGWTELYGYLRGKGIQESKILECGLAVRKEATGAVYDRFRDRVMFPLCDMGGRVIAFAGRGMDADAQPKYLNSPETALYQKSRVLYGLHKARRNAREQGGLLIVEGYMDYLTLYQAGIRNAAAVSGTAFTDEHAYMTADHARMVAFAKRVTFAFDGDRAGQSAAQRALFVLAPFNIQAFALTLPGGDDPDSFVKREGADAFRKLLATAKAAEDFLIDKLVSESDGSPRGKSGVIDELLPYARALSDAIVRDAFLDKLAQRLRVDKKHVFGRMKNALRRPEDSQAKGAETSRNPVAIGGLEESFLRILITKPELIVQAKQYVSPEILTDTLSAEIYSIILSEYAKNGDLSGLPDICGGGEDIGRAVSMLAVKPALAENIQDELVQKVLLLRKKFLKARISELKESLDACPEEQKGELMLLLKDYGAQLKELD